MSYLGFAKILSRDFLKNFKNPRVLEIGIDTGQTAMPLISNLSCLFDSFTYTGIDVNIKIEHNKFEWKTPDKAFSFSSHA